MFSKHKYSSLVDIITILATDATGRSREKYRHGFIVRPEASNPYCIVLSSRAEARLPLGEPLPARTKAGFRTHLERLRAAFQQRTDLVSFIHTLITFPIKLRHSPKL